LAKINGGICPILVKIDAKSKNSDFQKDYVSLLLVSKTTFPAWNNSKP
jgi:hypothetical protein